MCTQHMFLCRNNENINTLNVIKISDKNAICKQQSLDQIRVYNFCHFTVKYYKKELYKKQNLGQTVWNKVFKFQRFAVFFVFFLMK